MELKKTNTDLPFTAVFGTPSKTFLQQLVPSQYLTILLKLILFARPRRAGRVP
jgi:hypothetical protein